MSDFIFFVAAIITISGAIGVIALAKPFYSVLALAAHLVALAALFLLLQAEFVAFAQVIVYAGAVMVLYVFVVQYVGEEAQPLAQNPSRVATLAARHPVLRGVLGRHHPDAVGRTGRRAQRAAHTFLQARVLEAM